MKIVACIVVTLIILAAIWGAEQDRKERKRRQRLQDAAHDQRNWQQAFMRDVRNGYPRH